MKHRDIKPLRIVFSVLLAIISVFCFMSFAYLKTVRKALSENIFSELFSNVDLLDAEFGSIASGINIEGIDEDSTVADALSIVIVETAKEEFNYNISKEEVDEILDDPQFREDLGNLSGDFVSGFLSGNLDTDDLADDIDDLISNNKEMIEEVSGYEITDEMIDEIHTAVATVDTNTTGFSKAEYEQIYTYKNVITDSLIYGFLGAGVLCVIGIMLFNMFKLPTGFRTNGISFIVDAAFLGLSGVVVRYSPKMIVSLVNELVFSNNNSIDSGVINELVDNYAAKVAAELLVPALVFIVLGIIFMVVQGVLLAVSKDK